MAKILCVSNQKGGVGKTTTTNALAMGLRRKGSRVLCVDFDPQGNLSFSLGADNRIELQNSVYHALKGELQPVQTIQHTPLCDVIPANLLLSGTACTRCGISMTISSSIPRRHWESSPSMPSPPRTMC